MKLKHFVKGSLLAGLVLLPVLGTTVDAAPAPEESEATIRFSVEEPPTIIDPKNPGQDNDDQSGTGQTGPLTLDYVPNLDFGTHELSVAEETYEAIDPKPFVQVTDRRGTGAGWNLTVQASSFSTGGSGLQESLPGAELTFTDGEAVSRLSSLLAPDVNNSIVVNTGGDATPVTTAIPGKGLGSWVTRWLKEEGADTNSKVELTVPQAAATPGSHTSTLTWTLTDAPGQ